MMIVDNKYEIGEFVYSVTDEEQKKRIVSSIKVFPSNHIIYVTTCGTSSCEFYDFEISKEENIEFKIK